MLLGFACGKVAGILLHVIDELIKLRIGLLGDRGAESLSESVVGPVGKPIQIGICHSLLSARCLTHAFPPFILLAVVGETSGGGVGRTHEDCQRTRHFIFVQIIMIRIGVMILRRYAGGCKSQDSG